jgi:CMP-N,N'-diacetyllegionaminic acid synthase
MLRGKKLIAVIPVRKGSKGIPRKNLYKIQGETLLERTIKYAQASDLIDEIIVSTDCDEMLSIAQKSGARADSLRPISLADDHARSIDVVLQILDEYNHSDVIVLLLQVTTPLRNQQDLEQVLEIFQNSQASALVSLVDASDSPPAKMKVLKDGKVSSFLQTESEVPRQQLEQVYLPNGAFYLVYDSTLKSEKTFLPSDTLPYIMPWERSVNLDSAKDVVLLEALLQQKS